LSQECIKNIYGAVGNGKNLPVAFDLGGDSFCLEQPDGLVDIELAECRAKEGGAFPERVLNRAISTTEGGIEGRIDRSRDCFQSMQSARVGDVAPRPSRHEDFDAGAAVLLEDNHACPALGCSDPRQKPSSPRPQDRHVKVETQSSFRFGAVQ
jgi:hypothetical protein